MADTPTEVTSGAATGGVTGQQTGLSQALVDAIHAAVQTAVSQANSQTQEQLNSLSEAVNKVVKADSTDSDSGYLVRTSIDPGESQRRMEVLAEMVIADTIEFRKGADALLLRKISQDTDHHAGLPPLAPRSASGPGTSGS